MNFSDEAKYELVVSINNGQHTVTGEATLIDGISLLKPSSLQPQIDLRNYQGDSEYRYDNGSNGKVFQMTIVFNYLEVVDGDTAENYTSIVWNQNKEYRTTAGATEVIGKFSVLAFYNLLISNISPAEEGMVRLAKMPESIEYRLVAADENYATYMEVTSPSNGLVQEKPSFTNLQGGYGLFASRFNVRLAKPLSGSTLDTLSRGIYTKDLGFADRYDPYYIPWVD